MMHRKAHPLTWVVGKDRTAFTVAPDEGSGRLMLRRPGLLYGFQGKVFKDRIRECLSGIVISSWTFF